MPERLQYSLVLPPGWVHIVVREPGDKAVAALAKKLVSHLPKAQQPRLARLMCNHLEETIAQAREGNAQDVYFPTEMLGGSPVPMSIVVAEAPIPKGKSVSQVDALVGFAAMPGAEAKAIDGSLAVRTTGNLSAKCDEKGNVVVPPTKRISYLVSTTTGTPRLMLVMGSIIRLEADEKGELLDALEFLFESIVTTIRLGQKAESP
jgi:hypothetical protein